MGIYDRPYFREEQPQGLQLRLPTTAIGWIVLINVVVYLAQVFLAPENAHGFSDWLAFQVGDLTRPWMWWRAITSGFAHAYNNIGHIVANMLGLIFLGRRVEQKLGTREFVVFYLAAIVISAFAWALFGKFFMHYSDLDRAWGASGGVSAVVVLFAIYFPHVTLLMFFVIPMPAWLLGVMIIAYDVVGSFSAESKIGHSAHLGGAAFAAAYWYFGWNLSRLIPKRLSSLAPRWRPKLRVHEENEDDDDYASYQTGSPANRTRTEPRRETPRPAVRDRLAQEADLILDKVAKQGIDSLSDDERETLERYSRRMRARKE